MSTLTNSEDPPVFHHGMQCLSRIKRSEVKEVHFFMNIACGSVLIASPLGEVIQ